MSESRSATIQKLVKVTKKNYSAVKPPSQRNVLETIVYACILEDSDFGAADEAFAKLEQYADWNEVRVSTVAELAEIMSGLTRPMEAADRLRSVLHSIFETHYSYDLDFLIKESQGKAIAQIEKYIGSTPFIVGYVVQNSLDGHKIPVSESILELADALGLISPKDRKAKSVPGIDRAVPKTKGAEFFSTVHQLAVAYEKTPFSNDVRKIILEISPDAKDRLKKRPSKAVEKPKKATKSSAKKEAGTKSAKKSETTKSKTEKPATKKSATKKAATKKPASKPATANKKTTKKPATKKAATKKSAKPATKRPATKKSAKKTTKKKSASPTKKKTTKKASSKISKRKPR